MAISGQFGRRGAAGEGRRGLELAKGLLSVLRAEKLPRPAHRCSATRPRSCWPALSALVTRTGSFSEPSRSSARVFLRMSAWVFLDRRALFEHYKGGRIVDHGADSPRDQSPGGRRPEEQSDEEADRQRDGAQSPSSGRFRGPGAGDGGTKIRSTPVVASSTATITTTAVMIAVPAGKLAVHRNQTQPP